jgi:hypothetical protein
MTSSHGRTCLSFPIHRLHHMYIPYYHKVYKFWSQTLCVSLAHPALVLRCFAFMHLANLHHFLICAFTLLV